MSNAKYTYVGPYLRCKKKLVVQSVTERGCVRKGCGNYHTPRPTTLTSFCSACGRSLSHFERTFETEAIEPDELTNEALHALNSNHAVEGGRERDQYDYLAPNVNRQQPREFEQEDAGVYPLDLFAPGIEREWFARAFAPEIALAREAYGAESVEIHWGVIVYWS